MITIILFGALISLLLYYFFTLKSRSEYFVQRNIPDPPPKLFFGNYLSIWNTVHRHFRARHFRAQHISARHIRAKTSS